MYDVIKRDILSRAYTKNCIIMYGYINDRSPVHVILECKDEQEKLKVQKIIDARTIITHYDYIDMLLCNRGHIAITHSTNNKKKVLLDINGGGNRLKIVDEAPLVYDTHKTIKLDSVDNLLNGRSVRTYTMQTIRQLEKYRYINTTFTNVSKKNEKDIFNFINTVFNILRKSLYNYNYNIELVGNGSGTIIDTVSITFYNVKDLLMTFTKSFPGIGVEVVLTNSRLDEKTMDSNIGNYLKAQSIHINDEDGVLVVDGQQLNVSRYDIYNSLEIIKDVLDIHTIQEEIIQCAV